MRVAEAFAGVGGFSLGLHRAGFEHVALIEWEPYAQQILRKRFPGVPLLSDVCEVTGDDLPAFDILAGSPPCQSASVAGRRGGRDDERWLWSEFLRLVSECRPAVFVAENVPGLLSLEDGDAFASILEEAGALSYSVEWDILSAAAVGAPHRRERVFIVGRRDGRQTWPQSEQPSLFPGRPQAWPKAGRWTDGTLYERERQWPTPERAGAWGTASARDWKDGACQAANVEINGLLGREVVMGTASGRLSPDWTETLMGLPVGWTDPSCDEPEPRPYPWPMACGEVWPTPRTALASLYAESEQANANRGGASLATRCEDRRPLYGASPQAPWEPPRLVEPVKGDGRRHRLRCIGNCVVPACAEVIARSIAASLEREEEHAHAAR